MVSEDYKRISSESLKLSLGNQEENKVGKEEVFRFTGLYINEQT